MRPTLRFDLQIILLLEQFIEGWDFAEINLCLRADKRFDNHVLKLMYWAGDF